MSKVGEGVKCPENVRYVEPLLPSGGRLLRAVKISDVLATVTLFVRELLRSGRQVRLARLVRASLIAAVGGRRVSGFLRGLPPDGDTLIYSFWAVDCGYVLASKALKGLPRVVRVHRYDLYEESVGFIPYRASVLGGADMIAPISEDGLEYVSKSESVRSAGVVCEVHRLGTKDLGPGPWLPGAGVVRIVSCSSVIPVKRVEQIYDVVHELSLAFPVEWVHFGDGPGMDSLRRRVDEHSHTSLTVELRGQTSNSDVLGFYGRTPVDVFVNLSTSEGVPVSIMESMSFDIPVVATDVGGTGEIVSRELGSGVTVPVDALVGEISDIVLGVIRERRAFTARAVWREMCDTESNTAKFASRLVDIATHSVEGRA